jgi:hypothetical protein
MDWKKLIAYLDATPETASTRDSITIPGFGDSPTVRLSRDHEALTLSILRSKEDKSPGSKPAERYIVGTVKLTPSPNPLGLKPVAYCWSPCRAASFLCMTGQLNP